MGQHRRKAARFNWLVGLIPHVDPKREAKEKAKDKTGAGYSYLKSFSLNKAKQYNTQIKQSHYYLS